MNIQVLNGVELSSSRTFGDISIGDLRFGLGGAAHYAHSWRAVA